MTRLTVHFTGRVQGVGFRFTTCRVARRYRVAGYVMNLPDGRVRCVAEGEDDQVEAFVDDIIETMSRHITAQDVIGAPATGAFGDANDPGSFGVR